MSHHHFPSQFEQCITLTHAAPRSCRSAELDVAPAHRWFLQGTQIPTWTHSWRWGHQTTSSTPLPYTPGTPCNKKRAPCRRVKYTPMEIILPPNYHLLCSPCQVAFYLVGSGFSQKVRRMQPFLLDGSLPFKMLCAVCTHRRDGEL